MNVQQIFSLSPKITLSYPVAGLKDAKTYSGRLFCISCLDR